MLRDARIRRWFAVLLLLVAVVGTGAPLLLGREGMAILSLYASVPAAAASMLYLGGSATPVRPWFEPSASVEQPADARATSEAVRLKAWAVGYLALQTVAVLLLAATEVRPLLYYGVAAAVGTLLFVQVLSLDLTRSSVAVVLLETMGLLANLVWSVTLKYHYFFGRTDVFPHAAFVRRLLQDHHVTAAFGEYQPFPLWHVLTAMETALLGGALEPRTLMYVTNGVAFVLLVPIVYLAARRLGFTREVSLLAALFTCLNPFVIFNGMYSIPRNVAAVTFAATLLVLGRNRRAFTAVFLLFVAGIVVYHTISTPFILAILGTFLVAERVTGYRADAAADHLVSVPALTAIAAIQAGYWLLAAPGLVQQVVDLVAGLLDSGSSSSAAANTTRSVFAAPVPEVLNYVQYGLLILFVLYAVLRGVDAVRTSSRNRAAILTALVMCAVSFPGPLLVLNSLVTINIYRFGQYSFPFIGMGVAVGVVALARADLSLDGRAATALVLLLVLSTGFFAVSNDFVASDNPTVERQFYTYYFTEREMESMDTVQDLSESYVTVDFVACRYVEYQPDSDCHITQVNPGGREVFVDDGGLVLVRRGELAKRPMQLYETDSFDRNPNLYGGSDGVVRYFRRTSPIWDQLRASHSRVYDSGVVTAYDSE